MAPRFAIEELRQALIDHSIVALSGLPRVGRSDLAKTLKKDGSTTLLLDCGLQADLSTLSQVLTNNSSEFDIVVLDNADDQCCETLKTLGPSFAARKASRLMIVPQDHSIIRTLSNSLTGCFRIVELPPLSPDEVRAAIQKVEVVLPDASDFGEKTQTKVDTNWDQDILWLRGGLPESFFATDDPSSYRWRESYLRSYFRRDFSGWKSPISGSLENVFNEVVRNHSQPWNAQSLQAKLGLNRNQLVDAVRTLDYLGLVRKLQNWCEGHSSYIVRDSGLLHASVGVESFAALKSNVSLYGHSWEGFATEALIRARRSSCRSYRYLDASQNEVDLVLDFRPERARTIAIEFKTSDRNQLEKGFWIGCEEISKASPITDRLLVHSGPSDTQEKGYLRASLHRAASIIQTVT